MNTVKKEDKLCLLNPDLIHSEYPFSNITEYCLGDREAVLSYLRCREVSVDKLYSDYNLFCAVWNEIKKDSSFTACSIKSSVERLLDVTVDNMSAESAWSIAAELLLQKKNLAVSHLDRVGIAVLPRQNTDVLPKSLGSAELVPVICPLGISHFDHKMIRQSDIREGLRGFESAAVFAMGFEFEEPNEYVAKKAEDKLSVGQKLTDKERRILSSQLLRAVVIECASQKKELMIFLPPSPCVSSMGEVDKALDYIDGVLGVDHLLLTVFACDAVSICFAASLKGKDYKNITAAIGLCGNGCGLPDERSAEYWGIGGFPIAKASLARSPAYIGS